MTISPGAAPEFTSAGLSSSLKIIIGMIVPLGPILVCLVAFLMYKFLQHWRHAWLKFPSDDARHMQIPIAVQVGEKPFEDRLLDKSLPSANGNSSSGPLRQPKQEHYASPSELVEEMDRSDLPGYSAELDGTSRLRRQQLP